MRGLARDAVAEFKQAPIDYAFMARYRDGGNQPDIRIAGVVRRALAQAGFPTRPILQRLSKDYGANPDGAPASLLLAGSCLTEAVTGTQPAGLRVAEVGVSFLPQWILPWAPAAGKPTIGPLTACPQVDDNVRLYTISAYDAAAGAERRLDGAAPKSLAAQDGTQSLIEARFAAIIGVPAGETAATTAAADQAFLQSEQEPDNSLARPLFPRTLLALRTIAKAFGAVSDPHWFGRALRCVAPSHGQPRSEIRFTVSAWQADGAQVETPAPAVTLLVADQDTVRAEILPAELAASLCDQASDALSTQGSQRADAAVRAFSLNATPRIVILARVDDSYLTIMRRSRWHTAKPSGLRSATR